MHCAQRWSLVILIVTCYQLGICCNLSTVPDPERDCQSIECSWMGDIYFDFSKPPKEKINIREEIGIFQKRHFAKMQHSVLASSFTRGWNGKYFDPAAIVRTRGKENAGLSSVVLYKQVKLWFVPVGQSNTATDLRQNTLSVRIMREP